MMPSTTNAIPGKTIPELLACYAAIAYDKQNDFYEVIGDNSWNFDTESGTISFGPELVFPAQILGTFSHSSQTWLWAWANEQSKVPTPLLHQALQLKAYGEQYHIDLLSASDFDASEEDLHIIGSIASGMFDASGYYLADYGQGVMVITVQSAQVDQLRRNDSARILHAFSQAISFFEMQHKPAFLHYLTLKGYTTSDNGDSVTATNAQATLTATFDNLGRLTNLKGNSGS